MSAILGRIEFDGRPIDHARFSAVFERLKSWGGDVAESLIEGNVAVGCHILAIARAARNERLVGPVDGVIVVADAIIDNREELAGALGLSSAQIAEIADTELIRRSYLRWGEACVDRLLGDFAFAAIMSGGREVFLARDHVGARPLVWSMRGETLIFSSSVEAAIAFSDWSWRIDDRIVTEYLVAPTLPVSKPFFRDLHFVPPGSFVTFKGARSVTKSWWNPSTRAASRRMSEKDTVALCRDLLEKAVTSRTDTDGAVGAHFSGGIDSSAVSIIASRALRSRGSALARGYAWSPSVSSDYPAVHVRDERVRIEDLARKQDISVSFGRADGANFLKFIQRPLEFESEADLADEIPVQHAAQQDGIRVLLSGWGGDHAFSAHGHGYLAGLLLAGRLRRAKRFARSSASGLRNPEMLLPIIWRDVMRPLLPRSIHTLTTPLYFRNRSFAADHLLQQHSDLAWKRNPETKFDSRAARNLKVDFTTGHITMRMQAWAVQSAHHGFQYRYPLTDRRLVEFFFSLRPDQLYLNSRPRGLARAALSDLVPASLGKDDIANERLRADARYDAWVTLARQSTEGEFVDDCPWIDVKAFRAALSMPADQTVVQNVLAFYELFAAARVWWLYKRASTNGWV